MIETELFVIRYRINQAIHVTNISHIIVITDVIHSTKKIQLIDASLLSTVYYHSTESWKAFL